MAHSGEVHGGSRALAESSCANQLSAASSTAPTSFLDTATPNQACTKTVCRGTFAECSKQSPALQDMVGACHVYELALLPFQQACGKLGLGRQLVTLARMQRVHSCVDCENMHGGNQCRACATDATGTMTVAHDDHHARGVSWVSRCYLHTLLQVLVFADEFEDASRSFRPGRDSKWQVRLATHTARCMVCQVECHAGHHARTISAASAPRQSSQPGTAAAAAI